MQMRERATSTTSSKDLSFSGIWSQDRIFHMAGSFKKSSRDQKSPFSQVFRLSISLSKLKMASWCKDQKYLDFG